MIFLDWSLIRPGLTGDDDGFRFYVFRCPFFSQEAIPGAMQASAGGKSVADGTVGHPAKQRERHPQNICAGK